MIIDVLSKIVGTTLRQKDQDHLQVLINNLKIPSGFKFITGDAEDTLPYLIEVSRNLETYGPDFLLIACNAAHCFYEQVQEGVRYPGLNIAKESQHYVESIRGLKK